MYENDLVKAAFKVRSRVHAPFSKFSVAAALLTEVGNIFTGVVVTDSDAPALSCGACRQVLAEFNPEIKIVASLISGDMQKFNLS